MPYEMVTKVIPPIRTSFKEVEERLGRPPSRYEEAVLYFQQKENFHYRSAFAPDREIFDPAYTKLRMADYYAYYNFVDPKQYYYFTYCQARTKAYEALENHIEYAQERGLFDFAPEVKEVIASYFPQMRHYEWGASLIMSNATRFAYGTAIESRCCYEAFDRFGNAQTIGKLLLLWKEQAPDLLTESKRKWMEEAGVQPLRKMVEELLVASVEDWAEAAFGLALLDAVAYPLLFRDADGYYLARGATGISLVNKHFFDWYREKIEWAGTLFKSFAEDGEQGEANREIMAGWADKWQPSASEAFEGLSTVIKRGGATPQCQRQGFLKAVGL